VVGAGTRGLDQQRNARNPHHQAGGHRPADAVVTAEMGEDHHPDGNAGHQQGSNPRRHELLAPADAAVAAGEKKHSHDCGGDPLPLPGPVAGDVTTTDGPGVQEHAGDGKTGGSHQ